MIALVLDAGGNLSALDDRGMNAFMLAAGGGTLAFVNFCVNRKELMTAKYEFNFNQRNCDGRHAYNMVDNRGVCRNDYNQCRHLVDVLYMEEHGDKDAIWPEKRAILAEREKSGVASSANQRDRSQPPATGTWRERRWVNNRSSTPRRVPPPPPPRRGVPDITLGGLQ